MKLFFLLILLFSFSLSSAQALTSKFNSSSKRYELFDSKDNIIAYMNYNETIDQWEYKKVNDSPGSSSVEYNAELINELELKVANFNNRIVEAETLIGEINQIVRRKYGGEGLGKFTRLVMERLKSITDSSGKIYLHDDEVFKEYNSIMVNSFMEIMNKDSNDNKSKKSTRSKKVSTPKFARLLYRGAKFRSEPHPDSGLVYETKNLEMVTILEELDDSNWVKVRVGNNITGYITNKWLITNPSK